MDRSKASRSAAATAGWTTPGSGSSAADSTGSTSGRTTAEASSSASTVRGLVLDVERQLHGIAMLLIDGAVDAVGAGVERHLEALGLAGVDVLLQRLVAARAGDPEAV